MGQRLLSVLLLVALLAFVGCGSDSSSSDSTAAKEARAEENVHSAPPAATEPKITVPSGPPPKKLVVRDIEEGTGRVARKGDKIGTMYAGYLYKTGKKFESSWDDGAPIKFPFGMGRVIQGWELGIKGMKVGGLRELTIPPNLAYGPNGGGQIPANETLVFAVELVSVN